MLLSVIVPVHNAADCLRSCLEHLLHSDAGEFECVVVDDGSTDGSAAIARELGVSVVAAGPRRGPAHARNVGARAAKGEILLFVDADVWVEPDTVRRVKTFFEEHPAYSALFGCYDDEPFHRNFLSQYKNLAHAFVHRTAREEASTFWTGCGAIRRDAFEELGGFDERRDRPACEDIDLGFRLRLAGHRIRLDRTLQVKHLKRWTFWSLVMADIFERSVPWTQMILRHRFMPNDMNLDTSQRLSVALALALAAAVVASAMGLGGSLALAAALGAAHTALNWPLLRFLARRRGPLFALRAAPVNLLAHFYSGIAFGICVAVHPLRRVAPGYAGRDVQTGPL